MRPRKKAKKYQFTQRRFDLGRCMSGALGPTIINVYEDILTGTWRKEEAEDLHLAEFYRNGRLVVRVRVSQVADNVGVSSRAVSEYLRTLEKLGWIKRIVINGQYGSVLYCELGYVIDDGEVFYQDLWLDSAIDHMLQTAVERKFVEASPYAYRAYRKGQAASLVISKLGGDLVRDLLRNYVVTVLPDVVLERGLPTVEGHPVSGIPVLLPRIESNFQKGCRYKGEDSPSGLLCKIRDSKCLTTISSWTNPGPRLLHTGGEAEPHPRYEAGLPPRYEGGVRTRIENLETENLEERTKLPPSEVGVEKIGEQLVMNLIDHEGEEGSEGEGSSQDEPVAARSDWKSSVGSKMVAAARKTDEAKDRSRVKREAKAKAVQELSRHRPEDRETLAAYFRKIWDAELKVHFPDLPNVWLKGGRGKRVDPKKTIVYSLAEAYDQDALTALIRYVIRCWPSINARYLKGSGNFPSLEFVRKFHDGLAKEASLYDKYLRLQDNSRDSVSNDDDDVSFSLTNTRTDQNLELMEVKAQLMRMGVKV